MFQNQQVVIHVIRNSRAASVVADVLDGHRPSIWVSDLYSAQQGHADLSHTCLAHQLRDCQYAIEAGDEIFAPRMKTLLLRAVVLARRRMELAESTRRSYQRRLDRDLNAIMDWLLQIGTASDCENVTAGTEETVHIPRPSRHTARQQRKRTGTAANSYIPQGDRWLSIELGRRSVRCRPISRRHSRATWHRRLSSD